jgi:hypothetical protein
VTSTLRGRRHCKPRALTLAQVHRLGPHATHRCVCGCAGGVRRGPLLGRRAGSPDTDRMAFEESGLPRGPGITTRCATARRAGRVRELRMPARPRLARERAARRRRLNRPRVADRTPTLAFGRRCGITTQVMETASSVEDASRPAALTPPPAGRRRARRGARGGQRVTATPVSPTNARAATPPPALHLTVSFAFVQPLWRLPTLSTAWSFIT